MSTDTKRNFQGVWIPAAIWLDRSLSITEKVMLVEINSLESSDRGCYASNDHFSEFFGLSKSRVSELISGLAAKDLVRVDLIREGKQIVGRQIWMTETGRLLAGGVTPSEKATTSSENTHTPLRKRRRPSSENTVTPFGKGDDPSSEKAKESNTDSNNTLSNTESNPVSLPASAGEKVPSADTELQAVCRATWKSYSDAYFNRYGVEPVRNAAVNTSIKSFVQKLPYNEAPYVAAFFVSHNDKFYVQKTHPVFLLLKDAEGLRTQWATGQAMTSTRAAQLDGTATNANAAQEAIAMLRRRNGHASV
ncbi:hypothetical protein SAMN05216404_106181 [Nitrosospira multiformis]|uniref:Helix-turn-helix domain-containing protein n=1 Tax=Nitrosospira multiformis TaxID=1231 RepID=A0A1H8ITZ3_9PROT|nr:helix-turn-helix domain-containing protein [Nitrosospira multiformis]SEN71911.1 hypothetical protein SAMN05216404_106181 [Nitrosospira multiformis]